MSIVYTILELARHPVHIEKLREELSPYMPELLDKDISHSIHLDAVIHEFLRMYPPVPTALERMTPPEGIEIGGIHVPGNMTVWSPRYAMGRSESIRRFHMTVFLLLLLTLILTIILASAEEEIYTEANAFIPERWYLYPHMVKEKTAWAPFFPGT